MFKENASVTAVSFITKTNVRVKRLGALYFEENVHDCLSELLRFPKKFDRFLILSQSEGKNLVVLALIYPFERILLNATSQILYIDSQLLVFLIGFVALEDSDIVKSVEKRKGTICLIFLNKAFNFLSVFRCTFLCELFVNSFERILRFPLLLFEYIVLLFDL